MRTPVNTVPVSARVFFCPYCSTLVPGCVAFSLRTFRVSFPNPLLSDFPFIAQYRIPVPLATSISALNLLLLPTFIFPSQADTFLHSTSQSTYFPYSVSWGLGRAYYSPRLRSAGVRSFLIDRICEWVLQSTGLSRRRKQAEGAGKGTIEFLLFVVRRISVCLLSPCITACLKQ
uniref:Uncharacterized protein n=1 Tax=Trypanosoma vivax (strain Y486) TaxID=1055687 RepID=G0TYM4_TRYVY|nr:hypothetical protein TVY486_0704050 [Trypanosoma vivax Y486]